MTHPTALVIDDDKMLAMVLQSALEFCGFTVERITRSEQAMEKIRDMVPDLIVLDLNMPKISGIDIMTAVRADDQLKAIKMVLVTANSVAARDDTLNELADLILLKPVTMEQITELASRLTKPS